MNMSATIPHCPSDNCNSSGTTIGTKVLRPVPLSSRRATSNGQQQQSQQQPSSLHARASSWSSADTCSTAFQSIGSSFSKPHVVNKTLPCTTMGTGGTNTRARLPSSYRAVAGTTPVLNSQNIHGGRFSIYENNHYSSCSTPMEDQSKESATVIPPSSNSSFIFNPKSTSRSTLSSAIPTTTQEQPSMPSFLQSNFQPPPTALIRVSPFEPIVHDRKLWFTSTTAASTATSTTTDQSSTFTGHTMDSSQGYYRYAPSSRSISPLCGEEYKAWAEQRQRCMDHTLQANMEEEDEETEDYSFPNNQHINMTTSTTTNLNYKKDEDEVEEECHHFRPVSVSPPIPRESHLEQKEELVQLRTENEALKDRLRLLEKALVAERHTNSHCYTGPTVASMTPYLNHVNLEQPGDDRKLWEYQSSSCGGVVGRGGESEPSSVPRDHTMELLAGRENGRELKNSDDLDEADRSLEDNISRLGQMSVSKGFTSTVQNFTKEEKVSFREKKRRRTGDEVVSSKLHSD